jgi:hypothetical protein
VAPPIDVYVCTNEEKPVLHIAANTGSVTAVGGGGPTTSLAVDRLGNVFLGDVFGAGPGVVKLPVGGGAPTTLAPGFAAFGVAADWQGNVYAAGFHPGASGPQVIKLPAGGGPPSVIWTGTDNAWNVAVDGFENVYVLLLHPVRIVKVPAGGGSHTVFDFPGVLTGHFGNDFVSCFAVDPNGRDLYLDQSRTADDVILKVPMNGDPPTTLGTGLSGVQGIAVDASGTLYVSDTFHDRVVMISADSGQQLTISDAKLPVPIAIKPIRAQMDRTGSGRRVVRRRGGRRRRLARHRWPLHPDPAALTIAGHTGADCGTLRRWRRGEPRTRRATAQTPIAAPRGHQVWREAGVRCRRRCNGGG